MNDLIDYLVRLNRVSLFNSNRRSYTLDGAYRREYKSKIALFPENQSGCTPTLGTRKLLILMPRGMRTRKVFISFIIHSRSTDYNVYQRFVNGPR